MNKIIFFFLLLFYGFSFSQSNSELDKNPIKKVQIEKKQIEKFKKDPSLNYLLTPVKPSLIERFFLWIKKVFYNFLFKLLKIVFSGKKAHFIIMKIIKSLPYVTITFFLFFIYKYLLGVDLLKWREKKEYKSAKIFINEDEHIIKNEDIEELIIKAIEKKDYRLATRFFYLNILKNLSDKELIEWKPDKTNREYVKELSEKGMKGLFSKLSKIYDYVWYGKYFPGETDFLQVKEDYRKFMEQIKKV